MATAYFTAKDVARIFTEESDAQRTDGEKGKPVQTATVWRYVNWSQPPKTPGGKPGRYEGTPIPLPTYLHERAMVWFPGDGESLAELERRLRAWWHARLKRRGRPPKTRVGNCPCGCLTPVEPGTVCDTEAAWRAGISPAETGAQL